MINCHLSSISHRFWDIASQSRKPSNPRLSPRSSGLPSNSTVKLIMLKVRMLRYFYVKTTWSYIQSSCHNTLALQTPYRRYTTYNIMTIAGHCNEIATFSLKRWTIRVLKSCPLKQLLSATSRASLSIAAVHRFTEQTAAWCSCWLDLATTFMILIIHNPDAILTNGIHFYIKHARRLYFTFIYTQ